MLIRLSQVPPLVEQISGYRPHIVTVHRWAKKGTRGVKLRSTFAGGYRLTSAEWLREFFDEINRQDEAQDGNSFAGAERALERAGI